MFKTIRREALIAEAQGLVSDGTNPEYDRALVELITYASGGTEDDFLTVSKELFGTQRNFWFTDRADFEGTF